MIKILWLSNKVLSKQDTGTSGTWLDAMARGLICSSKIELGNITEGRVRQITRQDFGQVKQWIVRSSSYIFNYDGLPARETVAEIIRAVDEFSPDLIHVWGTESFWGLLTARKLINNPTLLEMQGLKGPISQVYNGGLSFWEQLACIGPKEILRQTSIFQLKKRFEKWGKFEKEIIAGHHFISIHSEWMVSQVKAINNSASIFRTDRALRYYFNENGTIFRSMPILRKDFYEKPPWIFSGSPTIFCSAPYPSPFKGLHIAIRSIVILKRRFPNIQLRIAGPHQLPGFRRDGYIAWINREIRRLGIESNVKWLGPLSAAQIVEELMKCSAFVLPTFIESYGVALAEAMILGVPTAVSYTGGTSYLARDEESALFFPPGDSSMCAHQLERLLTDNSLVERLSNQARVDASVRNDSAKIIQKQIEIYHQVLAAANKY